MPIFRWEIDDRKRQEKLENMVERLEDDKKELNQAKKEFMAKKLALEANRPGGGGSKDVPSGWEGEDTDLNKSGMEDHHTPEDD